MKPMKTDEIKQANRKALPKYILIMVAAFVLGGGIGFCGAYFGADQLRGALSTALSFFTEKVAPWLLPVCLVAELALCLPPYFSAKKLFADWDGEDEEVYQRIDRTLSSAMFANSMCLLVGLVLAGVAYCSGLEHPLMLLMCGAMLLVILIVSVLFQQRVVDFVKRLSPEKNGSVYDIKFQQKWLDSCDEAEKLMIGQCALQAYKATTLTCTILWVVLTLTALFLGTGPLPILAVGIIWGVSQWAYFRTERKLSRLR